MGFWQALEHFTNAAAAASANDRRSGDKRRAKVPQVQVANGRIQFSGLSNEGDSCRCSGKRK